MLELLLDAGARIERACSKDGRTLLGIAAQHGHLDVVASLIELGADPNEPMRNGDTPVWMATEKGHTQVVFYLHSLGASLTAHGGGMDIVYLARRHGHHELVEMLTQLEMNPGAGHLNAKWSI